MASEPVDPIDWSHPPPSQAVPPDRLVHGINRCSSAAAEIRSCNLQHARQPPCLHLSTFLKLYGRRYLNFANKLGLSTLKSILFIITTIVMRFYTLVCFCIFLCVPYSFSNYEQKTGKNGAVLKLNNFHSFQLRVRFLSPVSSGHYCE